MWTVNEKVAHQSGSTMKKSSKFYKENTRCIILNTLFYSQKIYKRDGVAPSSFRPLFTLRWSVVLENNQLVMSLLIIWSIFMQSTVQFDQLLVVAGSIDSFARFQ